MIKRFKQFTESISGRELVGPMGPNYGDVSIKNKTLSSRETEIIFSEITSKFYTHSDYSELYVEYLKSGGTPLSGFNKENLEEVLSKISH